jgi:hypothetical protein
MNNSNYYGMCHRPKCEHDYVIVPSVNKTLNYGKIYIKLISHDNNDSKFHISPT